MSIIPFNSNKFPSSDAVDIIMESELIDITVEQPLGFVLLPGIIGKVRLDILFFQIKVIRGKTCFVIK